jgi:hypothetical protein
LRPAQANLLKISNTKNRAGGVAQMAEHLPSKVQIPVPPKKKKKIGLGLWLKKTWLASVRPLVRSHTNARLTLILPYS